MGDDMARRGGSQARRLLGGGLVFASAALVVPLVAPAFACSASTFLHMDPTRGPIGTPINIEAKGFEPGGSALFKWGGPSGQLVSTGTVDAAGNVSARVEVPVYATIRPGARSAYYQVTVAQVKADNTPMSTSQVFEVIPAEEAVIDAPVTPEAPPAANVPVVDPPAVEAPPVLNPAPSGSGEQPVVALPVPTRATPAPTAPRVVPPVAKVAGPAPAPVTAPTAAVAPVLPVPAAAATPQLAVAPETIHVPEVGVAAPVDLWSGLRGGQMPSLLDGPAPSPRGTAPVVPILLASGIALLGLFAVGRRRAALAASVR